MSFMFKVSVNQPGVPGCQFFGQSFGDEGAEILWTPDRTLDARGGHLGSVPEWIPLGESGKGTTWARFAESFSSTGQPVEGWLLIATVKKGAPRGTRILIEGVRRGASPVEILSWVQGEDPRVEEKQEEANPFLEAFAPPKAKKPVKKAKADPPF